LFRREFRVADFWLLKFLEALNKNPDLSQEDDLKFAFTHNKLIIFLIDKNETRRLLSANRMTMMHVISHSIDAENSRQNSVDFFRTLKKIELLFAPLKNPPFDSLASPKTAMLITELIANQVGK
jgi:hypothetical protein